MYQNCSSKDQKCAVTATETTQSILPSHDSAYYYFKSHRIAFWGKERASQGRLIFIGTPWYSVRRDAIARDSLRMSLTRARGYIEYIDIRENTRSERGRATATRAISSYSTTIVSEKIAEERYSRYEVNQHLVRLLPLLCWELYAIQTAS